MSAPRDAGRDFMEFAGHMSGHGFDAVFTGRDHRKQVAELLVSKGLMVGMPARVCDGDGFGVEPERWRTGYQLTPEGRAKLAEFADADALADDEAGLDIELEARAAALLGVTVGRYRELMGDDPR